MKIERDCSKKIEYNVCKKIEKSNLTFVETVSQRIALFIFSFKNFIILFELFARFSILRGEVSMGRCVYFSVDVSVEKIKIPNLNVLSVEIAQVSNR